MAISGAGSREETERWLETVLELVRSGDVVRPGSAAEPPLVLTSALRGTGLVELLAVVDEKVRRHVRYIRGMSQPQHRHASWRSTPECTTRRRRGALATVHAA